MKGSVVGPILFLIVVAGGIFLYQTNDSFRNTVKDISFLITSGFNFSPVSFASNPPQTIKIGNIDYPLLFENPRWNHNPVTFYLDSGSGAGLPNFGEDDLDDVRAAFQIWSDKIDGVVTFSEVGNPEDADVIVSWFESQEKIEGIKGVTVVGEGGPTVLNTGLFNLITRGDVFLVPSDESCSNVNRAVHELGHVFGLGHSPDNSDVMYSIEVSCNQGLTDTTGEVVKKLYEIQANPDLTILSAAATKKGFLMDLEFVVKNQGLLDAPETFVTLVADGEEIDSFEIPKSSPSQTFTISYQNLRVPSGASNFLLVVDNDDAITEIFEDNNMLVLNPSG